MSSRTEREKQKAQQEKFQAVLSNLLKDDDNKYCVDCDAKGPRWASWNLGIFLCIRCAGIHRNLGVHISKVKSVNLDAWTAEQVAMVMEMGNSRARAVYEANLPDNYRRPQTDSALENFIRAKYETKKYIAKEWIPPKPTVPKELLEDDRDKKKSRPKASGNLQISSSMSRTSSAPQFSTTNKPEPKPTQTTSVKTETPVAKPISSSTADLIGLDVPSSPQNTSNSLLNDFMGLSDPQPSQPTSSQETNSQNLMPNGSLETNLFEDTSSSTSSSEPPKSTKDSILALYGGQQKQQQFNVPGGMYVAQNQAMPGMYQMPQQQQQQQPMMAPSNQVPMQQPQMYGNQMGMMAGSMGMPQQQGNMGMVHGNMGMQQQQQQGMMGMVPGMQQGMGMPQNNMYVQQQQMQFQQMQNQMAGMSLGQQGQVPGGMVQNSIPVGQGWGGAQSGQTLSNNLWQ